MNNVACLIARTNSKRLEKKVLRPVGRFTVIEYLINKIKGANLVNTIYLCTSIDEDDKILLDLANSNNIKGYPGDRERVIERMLKVAEIENADNLIRITGDNIFTDEIYLDLMLKYHILNNADYTRTEYLPIGVTAEVIKVQALKKCYSQIDPSYSEYLMLYMFRPDLFNCQVLIPPIRHRHPEWSLTIDTPSDLSRTLKIIGSNDTLLNYDDIVEVCKNNHIDNIICNNSSYIKLPADIMIFYDSFRREMELRIESSQKVYISENEYSEAVERAKLL